MYTVKFCHVCRPYSASIHESSKDKETGSVQICQTSREILINPIHIPIRLKFFSNRNDISIVERSNRSLFFLYFSKIREKKRKNKKRNKISRFRLILILGRINHRARRIFLADRGTTGADSPISRGNGRETTFFPPHCHAIRTPIRNIGHRRSAIIMSAEYKWSIGGHGSTNDGTRLSRT